MPGTVRADYDQLSNVAGKFRDQGSTVSNLLSKLQNQADSLNGVWIGQGAKQFQQEMQQNIYPGFQRMAQALGRASEVTQKCAQTFQQAEQDAKAKVTITITIS
jgi:WXG100 family type VII secretion target